MQRAAMSFPGKEISQTSFYPPSSTASSTAVSLTSAGRSGVHTSAKHVASRRQQSGCTDMPLNLCDFCGSLRPAWRYPAGSFFDMFGSRSKGDWLACQDCHVLIGAGDREKLTERPLKHQVRITVRP